MKKLPLLALSLLVICLSAVLVLFIFPDSLAKDNSKLISPQTYQKEVLALNQWFPKDYSDTFSDAPKISAKSALFFDSKTGTILYAKNPHLKLPIASLAKVMTAVIALEHHNLDVEFTISESAANMEPDKMLLLPGERLSLKELLYGVFLISANDAAEALAQETVGSRDEFIKLMNLKAAQLGMLDTHFVNPTGLDEDSESSYSTSYDLGLLTRYAIKYFPSLVEISSTPHIVLPQTSSHQDYDMYSGINLLTTFPGVAGLKTGYTPQAGLTLISLYKKGDREIMGVILGSENRRDEAKELLDYSIKKLE